MPRPRRAKKPKPEKPAPEFLRMELIEKLAHELISDHHPQLKRAHFVVLGKPKAGKRGEKIAHVVGHLASKELQALWKEGAGEDLHYIILVGRPEWDALKPEQRKVALDAVLNKFTGLDEKGKWGIRTDSDIEIDLPILRRYGAHSVELELLVKEAKQMGMFDKQAEG